MFFRDSAETLIRDAGGRATEIRVTILALLLAEEQAITHREIEARLSGQRPDRVTLYRGLQWLVDNGLIHKITSDDRVWRFHVNHDEHVHQHAHLNAPDAIRSFALKICRQRTVFLCQTVIGFRRWS